jgi:hypothetical protein
MHLDHPTLEWEASTVGACRQTGGNYLFINIIFKIFVLLLLLIPRSVNSREGCHDLKALNEKRSPNTTRCARASLDDVNPPSTPKTPNFVVADIACLPAPDFVIFQENFFSAIRKNKINFIL